MTPPGSATLTATTSASRAASESIRRPPPPSTRGIGRCTGDGCAHQPVDAVVVAREGHRLVGRQQRLHDRHRLGQPLDAGAGRIEADARPAVVVGCPAGAEREPDPAVRQLVERRHLLREQRRVPEVVAEHHRPERQVVGDQRGGREGGDGPELQVEVVGDAEPRVAQVLGPSGQVEPLRGGAGPGARTVKRNGRSEGVTRGWWPETDPRRWISAAGRTPGWRQPGQQLGLRAAEVGGQLGEGGHPLHHGEPRAVDAGPLGDAGPELGRLRERDHHVGAGQTLVESPLPGGGVGRRAGMTQHVEVHLVDELGVREVVVARLAARVGGELCRHRGEVEPGAAALQPSRHRRCARVRLEPRSVEADHDAALEVPGRAGRQRRQEGLRWLRGEVRLPHRALCRCRQGVGEVPVAAVDEAVASTKGP